MNLFVTFQLKLFVSNNNQIRRNWFSKQAFWREFNKYHMFYVKLLLFFEILHEKYVQVTMSFHSKTFWRKWCMYIIWCTSSTCIIYEAWVIYLSKYKFTTVNRLQVSHLQTAPTQKETWRSEKALFGMKRIILFNDQKIYRRSVLSLKLRSEYIGGKWIAWGDIFRQIV